MLAILEGGPMDGHECEVWDYIPQVEVNLPFDAPTEDGPVAVYIIGHHYQNGRMGYVFTGLKPPPGHPTREPGVTG